MSIYLDFTDKNMLWRLIIEYFVPIDTLQQIALKNILEKNFGANSIKKTSSTSKYGTTHFYQVILVDTKLSDEAITRYEKEYSQIY